MNKSHRECVEEFNKTFGQTVSSSFKEELFGNEKLISLRVDLIKEEYEETKQALKNNDMVEVVDGIIDMMYVVYGFAVVFGIRTNMPLKKVSFSDPNDFTNQIGTLIKSLEKYTKTPNELCLEKLINNLLSCLYSSYTLFNFDIVKAFDIVHNSNMSKACQNEKEALDSVNSYQTAGRYDSPTYKQIGDYFVVFNKNTGKTLKSMYYTAANLVDTLSKT